MNATAETINNFGTPLAPEQPPARVAQPFDIGSTVVPWAVEQHPYGAQASDTSTDPEQQCINSALVMPKVKRVYMSHPGRRPYENNPEVVGAVQTLNVSVKYPATQCPDGGTDERIGQAKVEKTNPKGKWLTLVRWPDTWAYPSNDVGADGFVRMESGDGEPDVAYWQPGEKVRVILRNMVKDTQTGATVASKTENVPVHVRGGHH